MMETCCALKHSSLTVVANFQVRRIAAKTNPTCSQPTVLAKLSNETLVSHVEFTATVTLQCVCTNQFSENIVLDVRKLHYIGFFQRWVINRHRHKSLPRSELDNSIRTNKIGWRYHQTDTTHVIVKHETWTLKLGALDTCADEIFLSHAMSTVQCVWANKIFKNVVFKSYELALL